jgi:hypothetical protein
MATALPPGVTPKQRSGALGTAGHAVLEAWYEGRAPAWDSYPGRVVEAGRHLLPRPDAVRAIVEGPIGAEPIPYPTPPTDDRPTVGFRFGGVLWVGFRDLLAFGGAELRRLGIVADVALFDYKTTASIARYAKDATALTADLQCNLYALATMAELDALTLRARWVYFETKKVRRAAPVDVTITRTAAEERVYAAADLARELDKIERSVDAPQNVNACEDYGGCSYHSSKGGPCNAVRSVGRLLQLTRKKTMALTEEQKAKFAKFGKKDGDAPATTAETAPTDGAPVDDAPPPPAQKAKPPAKAKPAAAPHPGGIAAIVATHHAEIAAAEGAIADATAKRDAAVAALKAALT